MQQYLLKGQTTEWKNVISAAEDGVPFLTNLLQKEGFNNDVFFSLPMFGKKEFVRLYTASDSKKIVIKEREEQKISNEIATYRFSANEQIGHVPHVESFQLDRVLYAVAPFIAGKPAMVDLPPLEASVDELFDRYVDAETFIFNFLVANADIDFGLNNIEDADHVIWSIDNEIAFMTLRNLRYIDLDDYWHTVFTKEFVGRFIEIDEDLDNDDYLEMPVPAKMDDILDEAIKRQHKNIKRVVAKKSLL
ncbi:MAG: hypothetical protein R3A45_04275 [Bdellovibrionota bacterium]